MKDQKQIWWCKVHKREATYTWNKPGFLIHGKITCDPKLGGILAPCQSELVDKPTASAAQPNTKVSDGGPVTPGFK